MICLPPETLLPATVDTARAQLAQRTRALRSARAQFTHAVFHNVLTSPSTRRFATGFKTAGKRTQKLEIEAIKLSDSDRVVLSSK